MNNNRLVLGSNSPRRQELLREAGFAFDIQTFDTDESFPDDMPVEQVAQFLSEKKNTFYRGKLNDEVLVTADTVVISDNNILGKPKSEQEATNMLQSLSDSMHTVITGVTISSSNITHSFSDTTEVFFKSLSNLEITYYVEQCRPFDKAGAYGIQEWIGMVGVQKINGSFYNVVGLPISLVYDVLRDEFGISPLRSR